MAGVRSMLTRVRRLEQARAVAPSPFEAMPRGLAGFEADCLAGIAAGYLDSRDVSEVVAAVRRWHREGAWAR